MRPLRPASHRLLALGRLLPTPTWLLVAIADWRTGFHIRSSIFALDYVSQRNRGRCRTISGWMPASTPLHHQENAAWIGVRAYNALSSFCRLTSGQHASPSAASTIPVPMPGWGSPSGDWR
jgi:hypothetical protein